MKTTTLVSCWTAGLFVAACGSEAPPIEPPETSDLEGDPVVIATTEAVATAAAASLTTNGAGGTSPTQGGGTTATSGTSVGGAASAGAGSSPAEESSSTESGGSASGGSAGANPSGHGGVGSSSDVTTEGPSTATSSAGGAGQPVTTGEPQPPPRIPIGAVFITEYVENGNDKAIELSNLGTTAVSLTACSLEIYFNGNSEAGDTVEFAVDLAPAGSHVLCRSSTSASAELVAVCDQMAPLSFNGNDAVVLRCNDVVHDSFGQVGFDGTVWRSGEPSSETGSWSGAFSSVDHVLRRRCDATPHTEPTLPFEAALTEDWFPAWSFVAPPSSGAAYEGLGDPACALPDRGASAGGAAGLE